MFREIGVGVYGRANGTGGNSVGVSGHSLAAAGAAGSFSNAGAGPTLFLATTTPPSAIPPTSGAWAVGSLIV